MTPAREKSLEARNPGRVLPGRVLPTRSRRSRRAPSATKIVDEMIQRDAADSMTR
jgi:hypothetical protein